jgi:uncharacterized protein (TIGR02597 family)
VNLSSTLPYFINLSVPQWRRQSGGTTDQNGVQLWPDTSFIIRNPASVTSPTTYTITGEVDMGNVAIPLATRDGTTLRQDNAVAMTRPVDVTLDDLNLGGTAAFVSSTGGTAGTRRDEVYIFNNSATGLNKSALLPYYFRDGIWNQQGGGTTDVGSTVIKAGDGFIIRKYGTSGGVTSFWLNTPSYSE